MANDSHDQRTGSAANTITGTGPDLGSGGRQEVLS